MDTQIEIQIYYLVVSVITGVIVGWVLYVILKAWLDKRKTDRALRISEAKYRTYLENAPIGIVIFDSKGKIIEANETFGWISGQDKNDLPGEFLDKIVNTGNNLDLVEKITSKTATSFDVSFYEDDQRFRAWNVNSIRMPDSEFLVYVIDITERVLLEEQMRQASKMEAVGQLASGVAHEFNNILHAVRGFSETLLEILPKKSKEYEYAHEINLAGEKASFVAKQLLNFSFKQQTEAREIKINEVITNITRMLNQTIGDNIEIDLILGKDLKPIYFDPNQLEVILMNLCINSRDAMPNGGRITVKTSMRRLYEAIAGFDFIAGEYIVLTVADSGIGMDEETRSRIFEPFFTTKPQGKGTGLGLPNVYGAVKSGKGIIKVQSETSKGTTFDIFIPAIKPGSYVSQNETVKKAAGGSERILLAEDDPALMKLAIDTLESSGYRVIAAENGRSAIKKAYLKISDIDMAILDYMMPGKNGYEVYQTLAELKPSLPVLIMSGSIVDEESISIIEKAGLRILRKPYSKKELLLSIREILDSKGS